MPNIKLMETALPVAPLKIAALDSCKDLGQKVNDYIVRFRQDALKESLKSPLFSRMAPRKERNTSTVLPAITDTSAHFPWRKSTKGSPMQN